MPSLSEVGSARSRSIGEKRRIVRNTLANSVVQFLQLASMFVFMPFLIRRFGLTDYGVYLLAGSVSVYLGLLDFGVGTTVMKYVAEYRAKNEAEKLGRLVSNALFYYSIVGVFAATVLFLFSRFGIGVLPSPRAKRSFGPEPVRCVCAHHPVRLATDGGRRRSQRAAAL